MWAKVLGPRVVSFFFFKISGEVGVKHTRERRSCKSLSPRKSLLVSPQSHLVYASLFCKRARQNKSSTDFKRESQLQHSGRNSLVCHSNGPIGNWLDPCRYQLILSLQLVCFFPFVNRSLILTKTTLLTFLGNGQGAYLGQTSITGVLRAKKGERDILREARDGREAQDDSSSLVFSHLALVSRFAQNAAFASLGSWSACWAGLPRANSCSLSPQGEGLSWELKFSRISWSRLSFVQLSLRLK